MTVRYALSSAVAGMGAAIVVTLGAAQGDRIPATGGDITITPLNHATLQIAQGSHVIDVDPVTQANFGSLPAPTIILVTDIHGDHLDPGAIAKLKAASTTVVAPDTSLFHNREL